MTPNFARASYFFSIGYEFFYARSPPTESMLQRSSRFETLRRPMSVPGDSATSWPEVQKDYERCTIAVGLKLHWNFVTIVQIIRTTEAPSHSSFV